VVRLGVSFFLGFTFYISIWCSGALLLCCSATQVPWCPGTWIPSFFVCQQPVSSANSSRAGSLITSTPLPSPSLPFPSLLSFTRQFHFYAAFSLVPSCRPTAAKLAQSWSPPWPPPTALPAAGGGSSSQIVYFRGPSQFVMRPPIGCGPGPLLGSHTRRLGSRTPANLAFAENLSPFGLIPFLTEPCPWETWLMPCEGERGSCE
jgi:hypothetical protein